MNLHKFIELTEPPTLTASLFPFVVGLVFVGYNYGNISILNSALLLLACCLLQMFVNCVDNLSDYHTSFRTNAKEFREKTNSLGVNGISYQEALITALLLAISVIILGIYLMYATTWWLLAIGVIGFLIGFLYSAGKPAISNTPFGELASGVTMGVGITYAVIMVNVPVMEYSWQLFLYGLLASALAIFPISDIMLANNICDQEEDIKLKRHTLVAYLGKEKALRLFALNYVFAYVALVLSMIATWMPWMMLIVLLSIPFVYRNTQKFFQVQVKKKTFILAVMNSTTMLLFTIIAGLAQLLSVYLNS